jgi:hypothetical protein
MGYTYLKLLTHTFRIIKMDHIFSYVSKKQGKTFILIYTHRKWLHGINLLIVNDFIFTHERKSSDEQLRKEIESSRSAFVSWCVYTISSFYLASLIILHDNDDDDVRLLLSSPPSSPTSSGRKWIYSCTQCKPFACLFLPLYKALSNIYNKTDTISCSLVLLNDR